MDPENKDSLKLIESSMTGFNLFEKQEKKYNDLYFGNLIHVYKNRSTEYSRSLIFLFFINLLWIAFGLLIKAVYYDGSD